METSALMVVAFMLFTLGCRYLAKLIVSPEWARGSTEYSKAALRFAHTYKVAAVSLCLALWFWALVSNFLSILSQPPF